MIIELYRYTKEDCLIYNEYTIVFGDNLLGKGTKGQACIRNMPNAFGIPTKKLPSMAPEAFFRDSDYDNIIPILNDKFNELESRSKIILPVHGIGTGLAKLPICAPKIYEYIQERLDKLVKIHNKQG